MIEIKNTQYLNDNRKQIKKLLRKFLTKSLRGHKYFKRYIQIIENAAERKNGLLLWADTNVLGEIQGYAVTIIMQDDMGNNNLIILQLYSLSLQNVLDKLSDYAKQSGINKLLFQTYSKRYELKQFLGPTWNMGPTIFEKVLV